jgi:UDP-N-acetylglucosamine--N-acetylmuramyl-(pentapeptide) pyrophosphoryl-undecaprenol N-acetylglucosamine transferase
MRYLLTGGGTGGHVYPALAIADEIRRRQQDAEFLYVGLRNKLESRVVPGRGYAMRYVCSRSFPRSSSLRALAVFCLVLGIGVARAVFILLRFRPHLIVGTGGYVSAPVLFAHGLLAKVGLSRAKVFLYEPNAYPGMLNQLAGRMAHRIGVAFEHAGRWFDMRRVAVVGYPVRRELLEVDRQQARQRLGIAPDRKVLFVFGGSGGSRVINEAVIRALPRLRQRQELLILHVTGRYSGPDYDAVRDTERDLRQQGIEGDTASWYRRFDYLDNIQEAYGAADLVVCRGGAGTLTEIGVCGLPALIVPLATAAEDHQAVNARELERQGAARVVYQKACWHNGSISSRLDEAQLAGEVLALFADEARRQRMAAAARSLPLKNSLELILSDIENLASGRRPPPLSLEFPPRVPTLPRDPNALLRMVRQRLLEAGGIERLDTCELAYLRYQADRLLVADEWYEIPLGRRNVGIKLAGLLQYREHLPLLLGILQDRRPVSPLRRLAGGDYHHCGLLRRNVIEQGIHQLGVADESIERVLLEALVADPYYEVRAAAARTLGVLFQPEARIEEALTAALDDRSSAVVAQAIRSLGHIGSRPDLLNLLRRFYLHRNWQFRLEVVGTLKRLTERGVLDPGEGRAQLNQILATSPYFQPKFPLEEGLRELARRIQQRMEIESRDRAGTNPGRRGCSTIWACTCTAMSKSCRFCGWWIRSVSGSSPAR